MANPAGYDGGNEWLELSNKSTINAVLENWYIVDNEKDKVLVNEEIALELN